MLEQMTPTGNKKIPAVAGMTGEEE